MGFLITPPQTASFNGDITQKKLSVTINDIVSLTANIASTLLDEDATATLGKKIYSINNFSSTAIVKIALGRTAEVDDYDYVLYPNTIIGDFDFSYQMISVIATEAATVSISHAKYLEV